jgi:Icc-related predicted phosphoesterase
MPDPTGSLGVAASPIRIAAMADIHFGDDSAGSLRPQLEELEGEVDLILVGGDISRHGLASEAAVFAAEIEHLPIPVVTVLGNHDYHADEQDQITKHLEAAGAVVLEGTTALIEVDGATVGVSGIKGFGGGFYGACGSDFGEPEMKAFIRHTKGAAAVLEEELRANFGDYKIALLHYSPVEMTLEGERLEIYPFLGSYLLGEAIDRSGADLVLHGHAHAGTEEGVTPGGIPVRNVAQPVIRKPFALYTLTP